MASRWSTKLVGAKEAWKGSNRYDMYNTYNAHDDHALLSCIHSAAHAAQQRRANAVMLELVYADPPSTCMECVHKTDQICISTFEMLSRSLEMGKAL